MKLQVIEYSSILPEKAEPLHDKLLISINLGKIFYPIRNILLAKPLYPQESTKKLCKKPRLSFPSPCLQSYYQCPVLYVQLSSLSLISIMTIGFTA
jgi:hypothetical protein